MEGNLKKPEQRRDFLEIASGFGVALFVKVICSNQIKQRHLNHSGGRCLCNLFLSWIKSLESQTTNNGEWIDDFLRNSGHLIWPSGPLFKF